MRRLMSERGSKSNLRIKRFRGVLCIFGCFNARKLDKSETRRKGGGGGGGEEEEGEEILSSSLPPRLAANGAFSVLTSDVIPQKKNHYCKPP